MERRVFWLCVLSFLIFAEGLSWITAGGLGPCLVAPEHSEQAANNDNQHYCPTFLAGSILSLERGFEWIKRDDNDKAVVAAFTVVLAISTIGLWLATNRLWSAGERQLLHLGDTAERQLRAYVMPDHVMAKVMRIGHAPEVEVKLRNAGQTPAYNVSNSMTYGFRVVHDNRVPEFDWGTALLSKATVAPNGEFFVLSGTEQLRAITQDGINAITNGKVVFVVWGEVRYTDAFGNQRTTKYKYILNAHSGLREGRMMAARDGNSAD
jgi:hypothetical protein